MCTGEKGTGQAGKPLSYKGSAFHRVIKEYVIYRISFLRLIAITNIRAACQVYVPGWGFYGRKWYRGYSFRAAAAFLETLFSLILGVIFKGTGGESIYGEKFEDEGFTVNHTRPFLLSMVR